MNYIISVREGATGTFHRAGRVMANTWCSRKAMMTKLYILFGSFDIFSRLQRLLLAIESRPRHRTS